MIRNLRKMWLVVLAATVVLAISQVTSAQPGEGRGRGGPGGPGGRGFAGPASTPIRLVTDEKVQEALKLSDEQKTKIDEINQQFRDDFRKLLQDGANREDMEKIGKDVTTKLADVLDDDQEKRLRGIIIQVRGANVLTNDPALAKELNITDEQKTKLEEAQEENMHTMREAFSEMRDSDLDPDEQRAKFEELRAAANKKLLAVLTSEQQEQLEALKGEKVDIDLSQMGGPGGRSGFEGRGLRGERGDRGRGERDRGDRDRESSESKSESDSN